MLISKKNTVPNVLTLYHIYDNFYPFYLPVTTIVLTDRLRFQRVKICSTKYKTAIITNQIVENLRGKGTNILKRYVSEFLCITLS